MTNDEITNYIFLSDKIEYADIALVFGIWDHWKDSVKKAVELYKDGKVTMVLLSHGVNPSTQINEGDMMEKEALRLGIPRDKLLLENKASNTLENVLFSQNILDQQIGLGKINSLVAVCANFHARRVYMTLKKHMPRHIKIKISPYDPSFINITKGNWSETEEGRKLVNGEVEKISQYVAKGDIAEL